MDEVEDKIEAVVAEVRLAEVRVAAPSVVSGVVDPIM